MFGMGLTLTLPDFGLIIKRPLPVLVGVVAQYLIMPLVRLDPVLRVPPSRRGRGRCDPRRLRARWYGLERDLLSGESGRRAVGHHDLDFDSARAPS